MVAIGARRYLVKSVAPQYSLYPALRASEGIVECLIPAINEKAGGLLHRLVFIRRIIHDYLTRAVGKWRETHTFEYKTNTVEN